MKEKGKCLNLKSIMLIGNNEFDFTTTLLHLTTGKVAVCIRFGTEPMLNLNTTKK